MGHALKTTSDRAKPTRWGRTLPRARRRLLGACLVTLLVAGAALAQPAPARPLQPAQVRLQVHDAVADQRFLPLLLARLRAQLVAPVVEIDALHLELAPLRGGWAGLRPMDAEPLLAQLLREGDGLSAPGSTRVVILAEDFRLSPARYNFAVSIGGPATPQRLSVVSLARLQVLDGTVDRDPAQTAERVFKLVAKNVARLAGYSASSLCLFGFPASLRELDALPENFCEPDLSALVAAGIVRAPPVLGKSPP
jgi:hypothetical protein